MEIKVVDSYEELSQVSAVLIKNELSAAQKLPFVLGLATGSTPIGLYQELIHHHRENDLDFSNVITFNLDEYVGLPASHPQSYHTFMFERFFHHINIPLRNIHIPEGDHPNLKYECEQYEKKICQTKGIDIQILGIGSNGHIGFNEPGSDPEGRTQIVQLTESTLKANARFFGDIVLVPRYAVSMGLKTILESKKIILLASGEEKAEAIQKMIEGDVTPQVPSSFLQSHSNITVIADKEAAKYLTKTTDHISN
ncbi:glucosamine-6-phosphate deaminase [Bacillus gobiensis]|uniref:glucosamine-6-phosphate deaminase n=1 Tax=Bacillus gobiensis TaxID=1441095 RepID=UPI003D1E143A